MASQQRSYKKFLTAEQRYDLWARMLPGQITQAGVAAEAGADRSVIARLRIVARDGAVAALALSKPGRSRQSRGEASENALAGPGASQRGLGAGRIRLRLPDRQSRKYRDAARV